MSSRSPNDLPDVFEFQSAREFLVAFAGRQRAKNRRWSLGVWARQLGFKHTATLSRALSGHRGTGSELAEKLIAYFRFTALQARYFRYLVLRESVPASLLDDVPETPRSQAQGEKIMIRIEHGTVLLLQGAADLSACAALLKPNGLIPVPAMKEASMILVIGDYPQTSVGPFAEFYGGIFAQVANEPPHEGGLAIIHHVSSDPRIASLWRLFGHSHASGEAALSLQAGVYRGLAGPPGQAACFSVADAASALGEKRTTHVLGFTSGRFVPSKYEIVVRSRWRTMPVRAGDTIDVGPWPELSSTLAALRFRPQWWNAQHELECEIFSPTRR